VAGCDAAAGSDAGSRPDASLPLLSPQAIAPDRTAIINVITSNLFVVFATRKSLTEWR
jgi:hypothetical protein